MDGFGNNGIAENTIYVEDALIEWQNDPNNMIKNTFTPLKYDRISDKEKKQEIGKFDFKRNEIFDYEKSPEIELKSYESNGIIKKRYLTAYEYLSDLSIKDRDKYVYIVIGHATMIEFFF